MSTGTGPEAQSAMPMGAEGLRIQLEAARTEIERLTQERLAAVSYYEASDRLNIKLVKENERLRAALISCEHKPTVTMGGPKPCSCPRCKIIRAALGGKEGE